jgi:predicted nucleotidyltransferase
MEQAIVDKIKKRLNEVEKEHTVKILYALESGSRAWGFESTDSDYDVRFIYAHPKNWYLNILPKRDVIEYPILDEFDYSGWDLRKALFLMNKSNPVLFEWLKSPIVYFKDEFSFSILEETAQAYFSPISAIYHYLHMANGNFRQYLREEQVKIKKYFYVLRSVLACLWIEKYEESPPMAFQDMLPLITDKTLLETIYQLLAKKKSGAGLDLEPRIEPLNNFLEKTIQHLETAASGFNPREKPKQGLLEEGFIKILENTGT